MTVDNYIYKQKTISITQAKTYLDEISSYESKCDGNVQYLQVFLHILLALHFIDFRSDLKGRSLKWKNEGTINSAFLFCNKPNI